MTERAAHVDEQGWARMVDVGAKPAEDRRATAQAVVRLGLDATRALASGRLAKGDAIAVARIAAIQGAKRTAEIIPLCHPLPLDHVAADVVLDETQQVVTITASVAATARTGVEMEALTAAAAGALAIYDMVKGEAGPAPVIERIHLVEKRVAGQLRSSAPTT